MYVLVLPYFAASHSLFPFPLDHIGKKAIWLFVWSCPFLFQSFESGSTLNYTSQIISIFKVKIYVRDCIWEVGISVFMLENPSQMKLQGATFKRGQRSSRHRSDPKSGFTSSSRRSPLSSSSSSRSDPEMAKSVRFDWTLTRTLDSWWRAGRDTEQRTSSYSVCHASCPIRLEDI